MDFLVLTVSEPVAAAGAPWGSDELRLDNAGMWPFGREEL